MIELDPSQLAPDAAMLLAGCPALPALQWHLRPRHFAKEALDGMDDARLLAQQSVMDEGMAAAVRSLLYLWNGYPTEASMFALGAPPQVRFYLLGICERQLGHSDRAKAAFRQLETNPIHAQLLDFAVETLTQTTDPLVTRFRQLLDLDRTWEPFLFTDLTEQAAAGKLTADTDTLVRTLQCREFELLFCYCYERATGQPIPQHPQSESNAQREENLKRMKKLAEKHRGRPIPSPDLSPPGEKTPTGPKSAGSKAQVLRESVPTVTVKCPKCALVIHLPESSRGKPAQCNACGAAFLIPTRQAISLVSATKQH
jgi:hypothetical protein